MSLFYIDIDKNERPANKAYGVGEEWEIRPFCKCAFCNRQREINLRNR